MHHTTIDRWSRGRSAIHRLDARAKILSLLIVLIAVGTAPTAGIWRTGAGFGALAVASAGLARLPVLGVFTRSLAVLPFSLTFAVIVYLTGDAVRAFALLIKSYISASFVLLLVGTTPLPHLMRGFERLGFPAMLVLVIQYLYRYLFVISTEAQRMRTAAISRGLQRAGFQVAAGAVATLFARSYHRAEGIHRAMVARGFERHIPILAAERLTPADGLLVLLTLSIAVIIRIGAVR